MKEYNTKDFMIFEYSMIFIKIKQCAKMAFKCNLNHITYLFHIVLHIGHTISHN